MADEIFSDGMTDEEVKKLYDMLAVIEENVERNMSDYRE